MPDSKVQVTSYGAVKVTPDGIVELLQPLVCVPFRPTDCSDFNIQLGPGPFSGCSAIGDSRIYCPLDFDAYITLHGTVDDDVRINGVIFQEGEFPFYDTSGICAENNGKNGTHDFSFGGMLPAGTPFQIEVLNNFSGTCQLFAALAVHPCFGPSQIAIYVGNENAFTDDDFDLTLNGVSIATIIESDDSCRPGACRGFLVLPTAAGTPPIIGGSAGCGGVPMALQYIYSPALNPVLSGIVHIELNSIHDNGCGNFGILSVYKMHPDLSLGEAMCSVIYGTNTAVDVCLI